MIVSYLFSLYNRYFSCSPFFNISILTGIVNCHHLTFLVSFSQQLFFSNPFLIYNTIKCENDKISSSHCRTLENQLQQWINGNKCSTPSHDLELKYSTFLRTFFFLHICLPLVHPQAPLILTYHNYHHHHHHHHHHFTPHYLLFLFQIMLFS